jgi:hypothetical protein
LLLGLGALGNWILTWVGFAQPVAEAVAAAGPGAAWGRILLDALAAQPLRPLIAAHISLALAFVAIRIVYDLLPDLGLVEDGLAVHRFLRWQVVPWAHVHTVRLATLGDPAEQPAPQRLVVVQGTWLRWCLGPRLVSMVMGAGFNPAVLFTSDIRDFGPLMLRLYKEVKKAAPQALFDDDFFAAPASILFEPAETLDGLVEQARTEGWPLDLSVQAMGAVAAGLLLAKLLGLLLWGGAWWQPVAILFLVSVEWMVGALYLYALAEFLPGSVEFGASALVYPMAQIPRAVLSVPMIMLVAVGLGWLAAVVGLIGVIWAVLLTSLLVQRIYRLDAMSPAIPGGVLHAGYLFILLAIALIG